MGTLDSTWPRLGFKTFSNLVPIKFYLNFIWEAFQTALYLLSSTIARTGKIQHLIGILFTLFCLLNIGTSNQNHILLYFRIQNGYFASFFVFFFFSFLLFLLESLPSPSYSSAPAETGIKWSLVDNKAPSYFSAKLNHTACNSIHKYVHTVKVS